MRRVHKNKHFPDEGSRKNAHFGWPLSDQRVDELGPCNLRKAKNPKEAPEGFHKKGRRNDVDFDEFRGKGLENDAFHTKKKSKPKRRI